MKKKIISGILMITLIIGVVGGCGNKGNSEEGTKDDGKKIELSMFHRYSDGASKEFFDEVAAEFEEEHPHIKINVSSADNANYKQEINVKLASNQAPDIFFAWSGVYAENFVNGGRALDMTSYIEEDKEWSDGIIANQFGPFTYDGKIYGIPLVMDGKTFYYNEEIFEKLGLTVPETWEEFKEVLNKISETEYIPISLGNQEDWATGHYMTTLNQRMVDADTLAADYALEGDFTDPQYVEALKRLEELVPYFTPEFNSTSYDTGISDFISGKAAIYYEQFNQVQYIQPAEFNWSWFDFPDIKEGKGNQDALTGAPQGFMISADTKYPDEAMEFLKFLTSKEVAEKMVKDTQMISCVEGAINEENANENLIKIAETIKEASSINLWLDNAMDSELVVAYMADIQKMAGGGMTPEEVMEDVQKVSTELKK